MTEVDTKARRSYLKQIWDLLEGGAYRPLEQPQVDGIGTSTIPSWELYVLGFGNRCAAGAPGSRTLAATSRTFGSTSSSLAQDTRRSVVE